MRRLVFALLSTVLLSVTLCACSGPVERSFAVSFPPFSADLNGPALATVRDAVAYASANPLAPLSIDGYHTRPDPTEPDTLRQERVHTVVGALTAAGVAGWRIEVLGTGIVYPQGVALPALPPRQVIIKIGL